jgi:hypothetical protein
MNGLLLTVAADRQVGSGETIAVGGSLALLGRPGRWVGVSAG